MGADAMARMVPATDTSGLCRWSLPARDSARASSKPARPAWAGRGAKCPKGNPWPLRSHSSRGRSAMSLACCAATDHCHSNRDIRTGIAVTWLSHACVSLQATHDGTGLFPLMSALSQRCETCPRVPLKMRRLILLQWRHGYTAAEVVWSQSWIRTYVKRILLRLFLPHSVSPKQ